MPAKAYALALGSAFAARACTVCPLLNGGAGEPRTKSQGGPDLTWL